jgi:hypothetical protein
MPNVQQGISNSQVYGNGDGLTATANGIHNRPGGLPLSRGDSKVAE